MTDSKSNCPSVEEARKRWKEKHYLTETFLLPELYRSKRLENFSGFKAEVAEVLKAVREGRSVFLTGKCGTGKTHLAIAMMFEWFINHIRVGRENWENEDHVIYPARPVFVPAIEIFLELKDNFGDGGASERNIIGRYSSVPFLVLDDIGVEKTSDWARNILNTLIGRRHMSKAQTIITSNLSLKKIGETIDDRISSRLVEMGCIVDMGEIDRRVNP